MNRAFDLSFIAKVIPQILPYLGATLMMVAGTVFFGSLLGAVLAKAKISGGRISKAMAGGYTVIVRSTPSIILLFIVFYGVPGIILGLTGINCNGLNTGIFVMITFTILFAASISEVMRSAYEAIDKGQYEAALSVGLSSFQAFRRIILPQCIVVGIPNFVNALINLMKEGALAYTIGFIDIMGKGTLIIGNHYGAYALETYIALAIIYWGLTLFTEFVFNKMEEHLSRGKRLIVH